jgi:S-formylglutathione hydrolase FrmB
VRGLAVLLVLSLAAAIAHGAAFTPAAIPRGKVLRFDPPAPTLAQSRRTVRVYLPPSYSDPSSSRRRYPVVFMLHGWPGSDGNWFELGHADRVADTLIAAGEIPEVILVCPNGSGAGWFGMSVWANDHAGRRKVEDYVVHDVVAWVDSSFRTLADAGHRGVLGLSDGATGALNLTLRHPDLFGACAGHSGEYALDPRWGGRRLFGPGSTEGARREALSPARYVSSLRDRAQRVEIYFDVGLSDDVLEDNRAFHRLLDSLQVRHTYHEFPGSHTWSYWREHLRQSLPAVTRQMR